MRTELSLLLFAPTGDAAQLSVAHVQGPVLCLYFVVIPSALEYELQNRVENLADVSTRCSGLLQGEPCFEAGIRELPFLMPEPAEKPSLHPFSPLVLQL